MTTPSPDLLAGIPAGFLKIHRSQLVVVAVVGLVLGVIGLFFPGATLLTVAILFGIYLIVSGVFRVTAAFLVDTASTGLRWLTGIAGVLVLAAGVICLANPFQSLIVLAVVIGIGWIAEGVVDLVAGVRGAVHPRWFAYLSGIVSIAAGVAMFVLPAAGILSLVVIGSILLIVVSLTTLLTLPRVARKGKA
jgi:uncharacterized membrane protein HdeD (DUF308 family)